MKKSCLYRIFLFVIVNVISLSVSYGQAKPDIWDSFTIVPDFQETVEKHISEVDRTIGLPEWIYYNRLYANIYENDELVLSTKDSAVMERYFQSFYRWAGDTLVIDGFYGLAEGFGFSLRIHDGKAKLSHLLISDEVPTYCYEENDMAALQLEVPCTDVTIILSEIPDPKLKYTTYGYVKFKSDEYYVIRKPGTGRDLKQKVKARTDMKIYFRSDFIPY